MSKVKISVICAAVLVMFIVVLSRVLADTGGDLQTSLNAYTTNNNWAMSLAITRYAVSDDYALATWIAGDDGGDAVFQNDGAWNVISLHGGGVRNVADLEVLGVPATDAQNLVEGVAILATANPLPSPSPPNCTADSLGYCWVLSATQTEQVGCTLQTPHGPISEQYTEPSFKTYSIYSGWGPMENATEQFTYPFNPNCPPPSTTAWNPQEPKIQYGDGNLP